MNTLDGFWLSYDLGLKGDYSGMYTLLDKLKAKECGDSLAFFNKTYEDDDAVGALKKEIEKSIKLSSDDRIYLVFFDKDDKKIKGQFLFGGRKRAPWEGYAPSGESTETDS